MAKNSASWFLFLILFLISPGLWAQFSVQGMVISGDNGEPLPAANVFLANTTKGTTTDTKGTFHLTHVSAGQFDLVVSYVGYETLVFQIRPNEPKFYRVALKPSANELAEVKVKAKRGPDWEANLAFFRQNFIGQSPNAEQCRLVNPEVIWFDDDRVKVRLQAGAREPLYIENQALGYRLKYQLESFVFDAQHKAVTYLGYPVFEAMKAHNARQERRWVANRRKAYLGSTMHFMRSLYQRRLPENGFLIQKIVEKTDPIPTSPNVPPKTVRYLIRDTLRYPEILDLSIPAQTRLQFNDLLQVTYLNESAEPGFLRMQSPFSTKPVRTSPQVSVVRMTTPFVDVEANGSYYEPLGILLEGYWSWEKIAELLPLDYELPL